MLNADQCQKPEAVGASGSKQVTAKVLVPSGAPDQDSCGLVALSPASVSARHSPSTMSSDVMSKDGTSASAAYGSGPGKRSET